jgi:hypothetical protein
MARKGGSRRRTAPRIDPRTSEEARLAFFAQVPPQTSTAPCWLWQGDLYPSNGYARFVFDGGWSWPAYRFSFLSIVGPVPAGMTIRHVCDDRRCVNPRHLVLGSKGDNARDHFVTKRALAAVAAAHGDRAGHLPTVAIHAPSRPDNRAAETFTSVYGAAVEVA